jgi:hypothetical protein
MRDHNLTARDHQRKEAHHRDPVGDAHNRAMPLRLRSIAQSNSRSIHSGHL